MNRIEASAALVTSAATTSSHHVSTTSPIGEPRFESATEPTTEAVAPARILITENEVAFSTAAAMPVRPTSIPWWREATDGLRAALHRMFMSSTADGARPRQDYPRRYTFLEYSCMAREMDRL